MRKRKAINHCIGQKVWGKHKLTECPRRALAYLISGHPSSTTALSASRLIGFSDKLPWDLRRMFVVEGVYSKETEGAKGMRENLQQGGVPIGSHV